MTGLRALALATFLVAWAHAVMAQQSVGDATVGGRVTDPSGAVIVGAEVTARHVDTNVVSVASTDDDGRFRFSHLRVGSYEVSVRQRGFADVTRALTLGVGSAFELPVSMALAALDASVSVVGRAPVLETARSQIAATVAQAEVQALPLNGRQFLEIGLLVPGVSPTNLGSTQLFPETSAVPGVSLSISSQRNLSNSFIVDGLSANDDAAGLSGITYAVDAVEQFQVVTSGGQAALGRALGGYVNVVTRSGTNVFRGDVYDFVRDARFNATNALSGTRLPMSQAQYGASAGGPLRADRTFYFGNFEQRRLNQSGLTTISPGVVSAINQHLAATGYRGSLVATGVYPNPVDSTNLLVKVDHQIRGGNQIGLRYSLYDADSRNSRGAGGLSAPSASSGLDNRDQFVAASHTMTLSARTVLETRGQFGHSDLQSLPTDPVGPAVAIAGVASFGRMSGSPTARLNHLAQVVNNLSHQAGAHAVRLGLDVLYNDDRITYPRAVGGSYTFSSLASFLAGTYNNAGFTQTFGDTDVSQSNPNLGMYAQDEWKIARGVTLNAGVRYDLQFLETIHTDGNNVSPRLGLAWSPSDSGRTVLRVGGGLFYDRVPLRAVANALLSAGNTTDLTALRQTTVSLSPTQAGAPTFPNVFPRVVPSVTLVSFTTMDRHLQNASSRQASVELEQRLGSGITTSLGYQYLDGRNLLASVNQNVPTCVASGTNNGCRPDPNYANNNQYSSVASSVYHGFHVSLQQRPARWGHYRVSYTLSTSRNNVGEFFFSSPIDPFDISKDWGRSDDDQRQRLVLSGAVRTPTTPASTVWQRLVHGFQLSGALQAYSSLPFNITSGLTTIQGTAARPVVDGAFIERNAGVGSDFFTISARVSRAVRLAGRVEMEALAEAFNLTDRANAVTRNTNFGSGAYPTNPAPNFGQVTAVGEPRALQLGLRVRF